MKVYTTFSGRRATSELRDCEAKGHIETAPHYNTVFKALGSESLTPVLKSLVEASAAPLKAVETDFAVHSSGLAHARLSDGSTKSTARFTASTNGSRSI